MKVWDRICSFFPTQVVCVKISTCVVWMMQVLFVIVLLFLVSIAGETERQGVSIPFGIGEEQNDLLSRHLRRARKLEGAISILRRHLDYIESLPQEDKQKINEVLAD